MANINPALVAHLDVSRKVQIAHLVRIELPDGEGAAAYHTDYSRAITYNGQPYYPGKLKSIGSVKQTNELSAYTLTVTTTGADDQEIANAIDSGSFLSRTISIHRVYLDADGAIIPYYLDGTSLLFFEGTISEVSIDENSPATGNGTSKIMWKCANEFYDLERLGGRITDDEAHRGVIVDEDGNAVASTAARRPEYQGDNGFFHANKSVNVLAKYQTREKAYRLKKKRSGLFGWKKSYYMEEYWTTVKREVDMRFDLTAKYLPVVYGVQKVDGIPIFADTLKNNPKKVYVVYAICEGEIDGFLDIHLDDKPLVCQDSNDASERGCVGVKRYDGDTMSVATPSYDPSEPSRHGQSYEYSDGDGPITFWTYHGKADQSASSVLVDIAANQNFYLQHTGSVTGPEYWDNSFKLLDTAYVVAVYDINENRTSIPTLSVEVQGRKTPIYNNEGLVSDDATSLNPAWQLLDYLQSPIFGGGIDATKIDFSSFINVAGIFDMIDTSYEESWLPYWRYVGWLKDRTEDARTAVQTNPAMNTDETVFSLVDSLLKQTSSSLNIVEGRYTLTVEAEAPPLKDYTLKDFVDGKISISDKTTKTKYNSVQASIFDPGLGWEKNEITFYNAEYKLEDLGVEKKSTLTFPFVTNYYCARSMAERELKKSRYSREVVFTLAYRELTLPINAPITITYDRFGWDKKSFLIRKTEWLSSGKVKVTAQEYTDDIFINSAKSDISNEHVPIISSKVLPPRDLSFDPAQPGDPADTQGTLKWYPSLTSDVTYYTVRYTGEVDILTVPTTTAQNPEEYIELAIPDLTTGIYTFEVRATAAARGYTSSPAILVVEVDEAGKLNLTDVSGFTLDNNVPAEGPYAWAGDSIELSWDANPEEGTTPSLRYVLQFWDGDFVSGELVRSMSITGAYNYSYTPSQNKADFLASRGSLGIYRALNVRIRAEADDGGRSVDWSYL